MTLQEHKIPICDVCDVPEGEGSCELCVQLRNEYYELCKAYEEYDKENQPQ